MCGDCQFPPRTATGGYGTARPVAKSGRGMLRPSVVLAGVLSCALSSLPASPAGAAAAPAPPLAAPPGEGTASRSAVLPPVQTRTLPDGLRVVVIEDHAAPVAHVQMWYRFGALDETPGKTGLAHALEHMMFRGTADVSSAAIDDMTARLGAEVNAETENEVTHYHFVVPADRVATIVRFEADRMRNLKLDPADWNLERGAVLEEYAQKHSNPASSFLYAVQQMVLPGSRLGGTSLGEKDDIEHASVDDLRAYYDRWYRPNDATLVVAGDVVPSAIFAEAERDFAGIPAAPLPPRREYALHPASGVEWTDRAAFPYTLIDEAYAAPGNAKPFEHDQVRNDVALDAMFSERGRFRTALVDSGLALACEPIRLEDRRASAIHVFIVVAPGHSARDVRSAYEKTMAQVLAGGIDPELFAAAKRRELAGLTYARDSVVGIGNAIGANMVFPGDTDPSQFDALYGEITLDEANAVARRVYAKPSVAATLVPDAGARFVPPEGISSSVTDDFGSRSADGPLVEPAWLRDALAKPLALRSAVDPAVTTLPNGLRLLVQRVATNPTVFVRGVVRTSPSFDAPGKEGTGEVLAGLLRWGGARYDADAQRKIADDLTATFSFGTSFGAHGRASDTRELLDVLADDLRSPRLPADKFALVRTQLAGFAGRRALQAGFQAERLFDAALYPAGDPALRVAGARSIENVTLDDVRAYHARYVRPDLTTLVVVGDVDPGAVRREVEAAFGGWRASGPAPDPHLPPIPVPAPQMRHVETNTEDVAVQLGTPALARTSPDYDALTLANAIFGGAGSLESRLFREVRERRGLVYTASSTLTADRDRGTFTIGFRAVPAKVDLAEAIVREELARMQEEDVAPEELEHAKTRVVAQQLIAEQATSAIAGDLLSIGTNDLPPTYFATLAQRYAGITAADVRRVAKTYFHPDNLVEVRVGPGF